MIAFALRAIVAFLPLVGSVAHAQAILVELHDSAAPTNARYTLGDIATLQMRDASVRARLAALVIGETPRFGHATRIDRNTIEQQVARLAPPLRSRLQWGGSQSITIRGKGQKITASKVIDAAAEHLGRLYGNKYNSLEIRPLGETTDLFVPYGATALRARAAPSDELSKRICVWVEVAIEGRHYRALPVWFEAKAMAPALIARFARAPGEVLRKADFGVATIDVAAYASTPLSPKDDALDTLRLKQNLPAGTPVLRSHVEERPAVVRNESVSITLQQGAIMIESTGIAVADGRIGETVKVKNPKSNEIFVAKVVSARTVTIDAR